MTLSDFRRITDELLSAYIDGEVSEQERTLVESAIAADEEIAWRVNSLRQTVSLLRDLPELALPRSFTLTLDQVRASQADEQLAALAAGASQTEQSPVGSPLPVAQPAFEPARARQQASPRSSQPGFWGQWQQGWREFWQAGNPVLRNAAAVSFALMLVLTGGGQILSRAVTQPGAMIASAPTMDSARESAAASSEAAPAAAVAILPTEAPAPLEQSEVAQPDRAAESASAPVAAAAAANVEAEETEGGESADAIEADTPESDAVQAYAPQADAVADEIDDETGDAAAASASEAPAAAVMAVPAESMPIAPNARGQGGGGDGTAGGMGGGGEGPIGPEMTQGMDGAGGGFPPTAYTFDTDPLAPTEVPPMADAEEAVSAAVAMVPAEESAAKAADEAPAEMEATPTVDAPVTVEAAAAGSAEMSATESVEIAEEMAEAPAAMAATPTVQGVALVAPDDITSSRVIGNVPADESVSRRGYALEVPVLWVAQGATLFLTLMLASLWWRSRMKPRPHNPSSREPDQ